MSTFYAQRNAGIIARVAAGETCAAVGRDKGLTRERVRQIVKRAKSAPVVPVDIPPRNRVVFHTMTDYKSRCCAKSLDESLTEVPGCLLRGSRAKCRYCGASLYVEVVSEVPRDA